MGEFRVLMEVTTDNYEGLVVLFREVSLSIERHLSGAVAWEAFGDEATGTVPIQEVFRSEDDADAYEKHMESNAFIARAYELFTSARVLTLGSISKPTWTAIAARPSSHRLSPNSGIRRGD
jgi:hypothetical protein